MGRADDARLAAPLSNPAVALVRRGRVLGRPHRRAGPVARARLAPDPAHHPVRRQDDEQHARGPRQPHRDRAVGGGAHLQAARRAERAARRAVHGRLHRELPGPHDLRADLHLPPAQRRDALRRDRRGPQAGGAGDAHAAPPSSRAARSRRSAAAARRTSPASTGWAGRARGSSRAAPRSGSPPTPPSTGRGPAGRARWPRWGATWPAGADRTSRRPWRRPRCRARRPSAGRARRRASRGPTPAPRAGCRGSPACSGSAGRRAVPGVVGSGGDDVGEPAGLHPARVEQQVHGGEQRTGPGRVGVPHVRRSDDDRLLLVRSWARNTRVATASWVASGGLAAAGTVVDGTGDGAGGGVRRGRRAGQQGVGEHPEQRRRTDGERDRPAGLPRRAAVDRSGVEHHRAGAARGDGVERRLVEHSAAGPRGGLEHRRAEGLGDHRARVGDRHAGPGRRAARGRARRGPRRRRAARRRSRRARPPRACPARCRRPRRRCRAPCRSGPRTAYPCRIAAAVATRSGSTARQVASRTGEPGGAPSANAVSSPPRRPCGASDRASSSSTSSVCSPGTVGSRCGVSTRG